MAEYFYNIDKTLNKVKNTHGTTVGEHTYTYDNNKNITQEVARTKTVVNTYDALNRLKTVTKNGVVTTYAYDQSGNRSQEVTGSITKDYVYDSKNKLSQITENDNGAVTKVTPYEYDLNGNLLTTKENDIIVETNVFNDRNELTSTTKNNTTTNYSYNVEGKRISKSDGNDTTKFVYDGTKIILEVDGNNNELSKNVYGLALVSRTSGSNSGYYLYNGHGDVVLIVDALNQALNTYEYDAFGNITNETEALDNPYKYAGYYYDSETGNYYLMSRYYNPAIARFISEDTYRGETNDPLSLNRYVYVNNNPLIYHDPDGNVLMPVITGIIGGGILGGGSRIVSNLMSGRDWYDGLPGATLEGMIIGGTFGFGGNPFVLGAVGGYFGNIVNQEATSIEKSGSLTEINQKEALTHGLTTAVSGQIFRIGGDAAQSGVNRVIDVATKSLLSGTAADITYQFMNNGIVTDTTGNITGYNFDRAVTKYNSYETLAVGMTAMVAGPAIDKAYTWAVNAAYGLKTTRPSWRESELDVGKDYKGYEQQKSFLDGEEVPYGTKNSSRPEYYNNKNSIEVKNYNIESSSGRNNLINNASNQVNQRINNLPDGTKQTLVIDTRGQTYNAATLQEIRAGIIQKSNTSVDVRFKR